MSRMIVDISWGTLWKVFAMVVLVVALFLVREVLALVFIAVVLSSAVHGPVTYFERYRIPRALSVPALFLLSGAVVGLLLYVLVPVALIQFQYLLDNVNAFKDPFLDVVGASEILSELEGGISGAFGALFQGGSAFFGFISKFLGNIFLVGVAIVISFYLSISRRGVERFLEAILPRAHERYGIELYIRTRRQLSRWLGGQLVLSLLVGVLTFIGLSILGIEYALALAVLAAVLELVPYVGPIVLGIVSFLVTLPQSLTTALLVVVVFLIIQQLENNVFVPLVMSKAVGVDPVVVVIALLAGASIAGLAGMIMAVPVTIVIQELLDDWTAHKRAEISQG